MKVNPKTFNYKLFNRTLLIAMVLLIFISLTSYRNTKEQEEFMAKELKLVQSELSKMIMIYQDSRSENDILIERFQQFKSKDLMALETFSAVSTEAAIIVKCQEEIIALKEECRILDSEISNLIAQNETLKKESETRNQDVESNMVALMKLAEKNKELNAIIGSIVVITAKKLKVESKITGRKQYDKTLKSLKIHKKEV
ncbi:hypothetical protein BZARG_489 [Bizionia argentinensis JUB59]|uniref:Uncharacterized protein n=1 Tax=Bizionia argentinensis JUB59 TaxID=1046627 RepID=G2EHA2_9FLAO|nr:hypothetical protein [Bizionia argentinensis]EGV42205.1 hypothetical protein BZARG_489 [Bizionia argentinensis JUB59]